MDIPAQKGSDVSAAINKRSTDFLSACIGSVTRNAAPGNVSWSSSMSRITTPTNASILSLVARSPSTNSGSIEAPLAPLTSQVSGRRGEQRHGNPLLGGPFHLEVRPHHPHQRSRSHRDPLQPSGARSQTSP